MVLRSGSGVVSRSAVVTRCVVKFGSVGSRLVIGFSGVGNRLVTLRRLVIGLSCVGRLVSFGSVHRLVRLCRVRRLVVRLGGVRGFGIVGLSSVGRFVGFGGGVRWLVVRLSCVGWFVRFCVSWFVVRFSGGRLVIGLSCVRFTGVGWFVIVLSGIGRFIGFCGVGWLVVGLSRRVIRRLSSGVVSRSRIVARSRCAGIRRFFVVASSGCVVNWFLIVARSSRGVSFDVVAASRCGLLVVFCNRSGIIARSAVDMIGSFVGAAVSRSWSVVGGSVLLVARCSGISCV